MIIKMNYQSKLINLQRVHQEKLDDIMAQESILCSSTPHSAAKHNSSAKTFGSLRTVQRYLKISREIYK